MENILSEREILTPAASKDSNPALQVPKRTDKHIWGIYIALCLISVVELYSASSHEIKASNVFAPVIRHVCFLIGGLIVMLWLQRTHYKKFYRWAFIFAAVSVVLMVYTLFFGDIINGARRSITVAGIQVQTAELVKFAAPLLVAAILCKEQMKGVDDVTTRGVVGVSVCVLLCGGLLFSQGLTNTLLLMSISISMMIIGGVGGKKLGIVLAAFAVFAMIAFAYKFYRASEREEKDPAVEATVVAGTDIEMPASGASTVESGASTDRFGTWMSRLNQYFAKDKYNEKITDKNQQEQYSYIAQAHGGAFGVLPGNSRETARLPLAFSDYIFAIIIEELGLCGGIGVLVLYLWLLARAGRIAYRCQTAFPALLVMGMAVFITFQALFHMAIVSGLLPVSGQPLPLISKGGTSILITSIALGVMLSVSRFAARKGKRAEIKEELAELPDEVKAENPT